MNPFFNLAVVGVGLWVSEPFSTFLTYILVSASGCILSSVCVLIVSHLRKDHAGPVSLIPPAWLIGVLTTGVIWLASRLCLPSAECNLPWLWGRTAVTLCTAMVACLFMRRNRSRARIGPSLSSVLLVTLLSSGLGVLCAELLLLPRELVGAQFGVLWLFSLSWASSLFTQTLDYEEQLTARITDAEQDAADAGQVDGAG